MLDEGHGRAGHDLAAAGELVRMPHVVLIREGDDVTRAPTCDGQEVGTEPQMPGVALDADRERSTNRELGEDRQGVIRRTVIAHHEFVGRRCLREVALELRTQIRRAIEGRERDGDRRNVSGHGTPCGHALWIGDRVGR